MNQLGSGSTFLGDHRNRFVSIADALAETGGKTELIKSDHSCVSRLGTLEYS